MEDIQLNDSTSGTPQDRRLSLAELKAQAAGQWAYIFEDLANELGPAMEARGHHVSCPVHGGSDGFRLFKDYPATGGGYCNTCGPQADGFALVAWVKGYAYRDAVRDIAAWLRKELSTPVETRRPPPPPPTPVDPAKAREMVRRIWLRTLPIAGTVAERYLLNRGIPRHSIPATLRFHPGLKYYGKEQICLGTFPALIAPIQGANAELIALHRIFLTNEGQKAPVPDAKKMTLCMGEPQGSAIMLLPAEKVLGVGEGIETMLAVHAMTGMPVWSAVSATLLELIRVPEWVERVVIWADKDVSERGQKAAAVLAKRLSEEGLSVDIQVPPTPIPEGSKGVDWLDVMNDIGSAGFTAQLRALPPAA